MLFTSMFDFKLFPGVRADAEQPFLTWEFIYLELFNLSLFSIMAKNKSGCRTALPDLRIYLSCVFYFILNIAGVSFKLNKDFRSKFILDLIRGKQI